MGVVSLNKGQGLYWLARYLTRASRLSMEVYSALDHGVGLGRAEEGLKAVQEFCDRLNIQASFPNLVTFLQLWFLDRRQNWSVWHNLQRAYDNALVLRDILPLEGFASLREGMNLLDSLTHPDLMVLREVVQDIYAFWGWFEEEAETLAFTLARFGRLVENLDLGLRLDWPRARLEFWQSQLRGLEAGLGVPVPAFELKLDEVNSLFERCFAEGS